MYELVFSIDTSRVGANKCIQMWTNVLLRMLPINNLNDGYEKNLK